ncbi:unnamed protein product [Caenorhabditis angaria]|uniref:Uncharacterized protein n=1 Tax=Caenorhabditis angaria TaxID=860376 RepID=A0A9P1I3Y5_9PELO|nr:unnamed protein product [Caenorhabditis angaria]
MFRQKLRSFTPNKPLNYQQWSRRRIIVSFVLFFVGWKAFGYTLNDMFLWTVDESTLQGRFLTPEEGKQRREAMERQKDLERHHKNFTVLNSPSSSSSTPKFDLDD